MGSCIVSFGLFSTHTHARSLLSVRPVALPLRPHRTASLQLPSLARGALCCLPLCAWRCCTSRQASLRSACVTAHVACCRRATASLASSPRQSSKVRPALPEFQRRLQLSAWSLRPVNAVSYALVVCIPVCAVPLLLLEKVLVGLVFPYAAFAALHFAFFVPFQFLTVGLAQSLNDA